MQVVSNVFVLTLEAASLGRQVCCLHRPPGLLLSEEVFIEIEAELRNRERERDREEEREIIIHGDGACCLGGRGCCWFFSF